MPIYLRNFVFNKLLEFHKEETPTVAKQSNIINRPDPVANYTTRASTK
jgi:hypothetical protein